MRPFRTTSLVCWHSFALAFAVASAADADDVSPPTKQAAPFAALAKEYESEMAPLLRQFCLDCHSSETKEGDMDLERFSGLAQVRRDPGAWQKVAEMLDQQEMPPRDSAQPTNEQKQSLRDWVRRYLDAESLANAGDPGPVVLRRLNNAEYTYTIRDLTGVALDPAREFPVDGASGEGFTNTGNALVMSPALFAKYLDAAKEIAGHAVLLPDGIRFSAGATRRDWTNELLSEIRAIYLKHTSGNRDVSSLDRWSIANPLEATDDDGRVNLQQYFAALIELREELMPEAAAIERVAAARQLNARHLRNLADAFLDDEPSSLLLRHLHSRLQSAAPEDAANVAREVSAWQQQLWKFNSVGHFGSIRPWQEAANPLVDSVTLRSEFAANTTDQDVLLYLVANAATGGNEQDTAIWRRPRIEFKDRPPILLREVGSLATQIERDLQAELPRTALYLQALAKMQLSRQSPAAAAAAAAAQQLDPDLLIAWAEFVGVGQGVDRSINGHFTKQLVKVQGYESINGWGENGTPSLVANSSHEAISFSTLTVPPHAVTVHPAPNLSAGVVWRSPINGRVQVRAAIADADDKCGNGAAWSVQLRREKDAVDVAIGAIDNGRTSEFQSAEPLDVHVGDCIWLLISARDHNHVCDTTHVSLTITEQDRPQRAWDLAGDVSSDVLAGNPHADAHGNAEVWHFISTPDEPQPAAKELPAGSALARWKTAVLNAAGENELAESAAAVQAAVNAESETLPDADKTVVQQIAAWDGPLRWAMRAKPTPDARGEQVSKYGLDPALFGPREKNGDVDPASLAVDTPNVKEVRLPAALVRGGALVVEGALATDSSGAGSVQFQLLTEKPTAPTRLVAGVPIVTLPNSPARQRLAAAYDDFRRLFPAAMCYARIVPVDETVTLVLFHREDEHLSRLMLDEEERQRLDRLWDELHYVSRDALTIVSAFEQLMEFATQDADPSVFVPLREPINARAAAFEQRLQQTESAHIDAIVDFAALAWRRPLSERESKDLRALYANLRSPQIAHDEAIRLMLARVLSAPAFLYRLENSGESEGPAPVSAWELASRLSYFLWSSAPDEELRGLAAAGKLHDPQVLVEQSRRMLRDPRSRRLAIEFACQWLHIRNFDQFDEKNERRFPGFGDLRGAMYEESVLFFADLFQNDRSVLNVLDADHTFVNGALARHYGIEDVAGDDWRRVEGVKAQSRGGVLAQATFLSSQSGASRTSPILRGNWIAETLLGERLPRPPKDVPQLPEEPAAGLTERQLIERHSSDPACAKCHAKIDPYGFALESFDAIGRFRQQDDAGQTIDTQATLPDGANIDGLDGLRNYLTTKRRDDFLRHFCRKLLGYALGRAVQLSDRPLIDEMMTHLETHDYRFSVAVETVVRSEQFQKIRGRGYDEATELSPADSPDDE